MVRPPPSATAAEYKVSGEVYLEDGFGQGHHTHDGSFFFVCFVLFLLKPGLSVQLCPQRGRVQQRRTVAPVERRREVNTVMV